MFKFCAKYVWLDTNLVQAILTRCAKKVKRSELHAKKAIWAACSVRIRQKSEKKPLKLDINKNKFAFFLKNEYNCNRE